MQKFDASQNPLIISLLKVYTTYRLKRNSSNECLGYCLEEGVWTILLNDSTGNGKSVSTKHQLCLEVLLSLPYFTQAVVNLCLKMV